MRFRYLGIALVFLVVGIGEVALHWYLGGHNSDRALRLRKMYLHRDADNGKRYVEGLVDFVVPTIVLGIAAGIIGSRLPPGGLTLCVVLLSLGVICLLPLYDALVPGTDPVWFGAKFEDRVRLILFGPPKVLALCAFFTCAARVLVQNFQPENVRQP
jgi:hypothetical protein